MYPNWYTTFQIDLRFHKKSKHVLLNKLSGFLGFLYIETTNEK